MLRVGILTFQNANNYGAVLQAFALQETLKKLGAKVQVINYDSPSMGLGHAQKQVFREFIQRYLALTEEVKCKEDIDTSMFDVIIAGSDQIWNPLLTGMDMTYFLDFAGKNVVKAAYAASIGLQEELAEQYGAVYEQYIPAIDAVSLRERSHLNFLERILPAEKEIYSLLDPSLLLSDMEYDEKLKLSEKREDYIFLFTYGRDSKLADMANMLSVYTGLPLIVYAGTGKFFFVKETRIVNDISPGKWLSYIKNARLVLTDSYHGTMLSIVMKRPFYVYAPERYNVLRITDALDMFGLRNRTLRDKTVKDIRFDLDYTYAFDVLEKEREKSGQFLKSVLDMPVHH